MKQFIARITLLVDDYDKAIHFYTKQLQFDLLEDTPLSATKRWVVVAPKGSRECALLLAKADKELQISRIGSQAGGRVGFFLYTDDFERDYELYKKNGVSFVREPVREAYGTVAVFKDLYGNQWDLIEHRNA